MFRPEVESDLEDAFAWYEARQTGLGSQFMQSVGAACREIQDRPLSHSTAHGQVRKASVGHYPYRIYFQVHEDGIIVPGIFHAARNPEVWKARSEPRA